MAAHHDSGPEDLLEWEGGDPPCWAHLFEDDVPTVPIESTDQAAVDADGVPSRESHTPTQERGRPAQSAGDS